MSITGLLLLIPPAVWSLMWLVALINQVTVMGEVATDIVSLKIVGRHSVGDWDNLMTTAVSNRTRTRLKVGIALLMFTGGLVAMAALLAGVPLLHSVLNFLISAQLFGAGFLFLRLSYHDRAMYRVAASNRLKKIAQHGGIE